MTFPKSGEEWGVGSDGYDRSAARKILGIDPGLARMGYGLVERRGNRLRALGYGTLETAKGRSTPDRLVELFEGLGRLLRRMRPDEAAVEELFFSKNVKTAIGVGHARGVALLACGMARVPVHEYKPGQVKQAVTGYGAADKRQVQRMVKVLLGLREVPKPDDTADALAIAITHAQAGPPRAAVIAGEEALLVRAISVFGGDPRTKGSAR
jgi:crossover junction endodeoxyribonuclease RuvC